MCGAAATRAGESPVRPAAVKLKYKTGALPCVRTPEYDATNDFRPALGRRGERTYMTCVRPHCPRAFVQNTIRSVGVEGEGVINTFRYRRGA